MNEDNSIYSVGVSVKNEWIIMTGNDSRALILDSKRMKLLS